MTVDATFRQLEEADQSITAQSAGESPLEIWYERVRDVPIGQLSDGDVCVACRQEVNLPQVVPVATARLRENPLAGESYDGELIVALAGIPRRFWVDHPVLAEQLRSVLSDVHVPSELDDIAQDLGKLRARVTQ